MMSYKKPKMKYHEALDVAIECLAGCMIHLDKTSFNQLNDSFDVLQDKRRSLNVKKYSKLSIRIEDND